MKENSKSKEETMAWLRSLPVRVRLGHEPHNPVDISEGVWEFAHASDMRLSTFVEEGPLFILLTHKIAKQIVEALTDYMDTFSEEDIDAHNEHELRCCQDPCVFIRQQIEARRIFRATEKEVKKRVVKPGYVYFIKADNGVVKIWMTANLEKRIKNFGVVLPFPIKVEHYFETRDMIMVERKFHEIFADRRIEGEWFDLSEDILESIKRGAYDRIVKEVEEGIS